MLQCGGCSCCRPGALGLHADINRNDACEDAILQLGKPEKPCFEEVITPMQPKKGEGFGVMNP